MCNTLKSAQVVPQKVLCYISNTARNTSLPQKLLSNLLRLPRSRRPQRCLDKAMLIRLSVLVVVDQEAKLALNVLLAVLHVRVNPELISLYKHYQKVVKGRELVIITTREKLSDSGNMLGVVGGAGFVIFGGNEERTLLTSGDDVDDERVVLGGPSGEVLAPGYCGGFAKVFGVEEGYEELIAVFGGRSHC